MRFLAATLVLMHHALQPPFTANPVPLPGRSAVIVFFVISGFVIAYVTDTRESRWQDYVVSRLARIYSVVIPALALTALLYLVARTGVVGSAPVVETYSNPVIGILVSALFLNQIWNLTVLALHNGPYWSIAYEVWYYIFFAVWLFAGRTYRTPAVVVLAVFVGPRILLLMPIWLIGVATYYGRCELLRRKSTVRSNWPFVAALAAFLVIFFLYNLADVVSNAIKAKFLDERSNLTGTSMYLGGDWSFPSDYLIGLSFALSVLVLPTTLVPEKVRQGILARTVRQASSYTFSLYRKRPARAVLTN